MATQPFGPPRTDLPPPRAVAEGDVLAERYLVESKVGEGGMGSVFAAKDLVLGRRVAIKVMHERLASVAGFAARFEREAKCASRVSHPGCVTVLDYRASEQGCFLVLEWLDATSLAAYVTGRQRLPSAEALELFRQLCDAIGAAHAAGVVHRALKPENVLLVAEPGGRFRVKLIDFGIAALVDGGSARLTAPTERIGSPEYMAPEQIRGEVVDHRADIYAAGAVLYFMLHGEPPFVGDINAVLRQHLAREPPRGRFAGRLARVIQRSLAKAPSRRYPTALAMRDEAKRTRTSGHARRWLPITAAAALIAVSVWFSADGARASSDQRAVDIACAKLGQRCAPKAVRAAAGGHLVEVMVDTEEVLMHVGTDDVAFIVRQTTPNRPTVSLLKRGDPK